jgi:hypothetical protein
MNAGAIVCSTAMTAMGREFLRMTGSLIQRFFALA